MGQQQEAPSRRGLDLGVDRVVMVEVAALHDPGARILHVLESDCVKLSAFSPSTRLEEDVPSAVEFRHRSRR